MQRTFDGQLLPTAPHPDDIVQTLDGPDLRRADVPCWSVDGEAFHDEDNRGEYELELVVSELNNIADWSYEYETTHPDAGNNYHHLLGECRENVKRILAAEVYGGPHLDELVDFAIEYAEPKPGGIYGYTGPGTEIGALEVGEIECQVEYHGILGELNKVGRLRNYLIAQRDHCVRVYEDHCYLYINTDAVWYFVVDGEDLQEELERYEEVSD